MPFLFCFSDVKNIKTPIEKKTNTDDYGLIAKYTGLSIEEIEGLVEKKKVKFRK